MKNDDVFLGKLVPPRWIQEPQDTALMLGQSVVIPCEADGYPEPEITWMKGGNGKCMFKYFFSSKESYIDMHKFIDKFE